MLFVWTLLAPDQRSGQLQSVGGSKPMLIERLRGQIANLLVRKNLPPATTQEFQASHGPLLAGIRQLFLAVKTANCVVHFHESSPPYHGRESSKVSRGTSCLVDAQRK